MKAASVLQQDSGVSIRKLFSRAARRPQRNEAERRRRLLRKRLLMQESLEERHLLAVMANDDFFDVFEDSNAVILDVFANDEDATGAIGSPSLDIVSIGPAANGTVVLDTTGPQDQITFTPSPNFNGQTSFTYRIDDTADGQSIMSTGTVTVTVTEVNDPPVAVGEDLGAIALEDGQSIFDTSLLTSNDSPGPANETGQTLSIANLATTSVAGGTLSLSNGGVVYTPAPNFNGTDTFTYQVQDNGSTNGAADPQTSNTVTATLTVTPVNDAPIPGFFDGNGSSTTPFIINVSGLFPSSQTGPVHAAGSADDESGQTLSFAGVASSSVQGGSVRLDNNGTPANPDDDVIEYIAPSPAFSGADSFTYTLMDSGGTANGGIDSATGTINLNITAPPPPPGTSARVDPNGNLVIDDPAGNDNQFRIEVDANDPTLLRISDPNSPLAAGPGATQDGDDVLIPIASITGELVVNGGDGDDELELDFSNGNPIPAGGVQFNGGGQSGPAGDILSVIGTFSNQIFDFQPPGPDGNNGSITVDGSVVTFTGLEPINAGNSVNTILNLPAGLANNAVLRNSAVAGEIEIIDNGATFEDTVIPNPTGSLTVNLGGQGDTLNVEALDPSFDASLVIAGGTGSDTVNLNGATTIDLASGDLVVDSFVEATNLTGSVASDGQTYAGPVFLADDTTLNSSGTNGNVILLSNVDGAHSLTVNASGTTTFLGAVGVVTPLTSLSTDAAGATAINGGAITTTGVQTYNDNVTVGADISFTGTTVGFNENLNSDAGNNRAVTVTGDAVVGDGPGDYIGNADALQSFVVTGTTTFNSIRVAADTVTTVGLQVYTGPVTLAGDDTRLTSTGGADISFLSTVDGADTLAINTSAGTVLFSDTVGGTTPLTSIESDAGGFTQFDGPSVTTTGSQTYNNTVVFGVDLTMTGDGIDLAGDVTSQIASQLTIDGGATNSTIGGEILGDFDLVKEGSGELTLGRESLNFTGDVNVDDGTLNLGTYQFGNPLRSAPVFSIDSGTLDATGLNNGEFSVGAGQLLEGDGNVIGNVIGNVSPGFGPGQFGVLNVNGPVSFNAGNTLEIQIDGSSPGTDQSQLISNAFVDIFPGSNLTLSGTAANLGPGDEVVVIDSQGGVNGPFDAFPEGAVIPNFLGSGQAAIVTYTGGDGNDMALLIGGGIIEVDPMGNLVIEDSTGTQDDQLTIRVDGPNYRISDPTNPLVAGVGATQDGPDVLVPIASVTGEIRVRTDGGNDDLTLDFSGGDLMNPVRFDGGGQTGAPGDSLSIVGNFTNQVFNYAPPGPDGNNGDVVLDGLVVTYTGLEPINGGDAVNTTLNLPVGLANNAVLRNSTVAGEIEIIDNGATFEDTVIPNPSGSLTINGGTDVDIISIDALDPAFAADVTIITGGAADTINIRGVDFPGDLSVADSDVAPDDTVNFNTAPTTANGLVDIDVQNTNINEPLTLGSLRIGVFDTPVPGGTTSIAANVTTTGDQLYNEVNTLGADVVLTGDSIIFRNTIDGAFALTLNDSAPVANSGASADIGSIVPLTSLTTDAVGGTTLSGNVTTTGNQTYGDQVRTGTLSGVQAFTSGGVITFDSTLDNATGVPTALTIDSAGVAVFNGPIGSGLIGDGPNAALTINTAGPFTLAQDTTVNGPLTINVADSAAAMDDLTIASGVAIDTNNGAVLFNAGDDVEVQAGATIDAGTAGVTINSDVADADMGVGTTIDLQGTLTAAADVAVNGGDDADLFVIASTSGVTFNLDGGDPSILPGDTLQLDAGGGTLVLTPAGLTLPGLIVNAQNIESINLMNVSDVMVTGDANDNNLTIANGLAPGSMRLTLDAGPEIVLPQVPVIFDGGDGDDTLTMDYTAGPVSIPVNFNGQGNAGAPGDQIALIGGIAQLVTHTFTNDSDGTIDIDFDGGGSDSLITYTGLEPVIDNINAVNREFTFLGGSETILVSDDGVASNNVSRIDSTLGELVDFVHPTNSLTINGGTGSDVIDIQNLDDATLVPILTINGDDEIDQITLDALPAGRTGTRVVNGGEGNDTLVGSSEVDTINGGTGADFIVGVGGGDLLFGDAGEDEFVWNNGDGPDDVTGGDDEDSFVFNGADGLDDVIAIAPGPGDGSLIGSEFNLTRFAPSAFSIEFATVENATVNGLAGNDRFEIADLSGQPNLDSLNLNGNDGDDFFDVFLNATVEINIDGGAPGAPALPGDVLNVTTPNELNIFSDKANNVSLTSSIGGAPTANLTYTSIETILALPTNGQVNLIGDNNDAGVDQPDNFVVVGRNVDSLVPGGDLDGANEASVFINGNTPSIDVYNVTDLNALGDDAALTPSAANDIDTLEITPWADDTPLGWGIDVYFDEGNPVATDGDQVDLLIYNTSAFGGQVSEDIVVRPSGPDNGELIVTNASFGTPIVDIDYVGNTDIIINDNDGFLNDTDTLTLLGTDGSSPQTSGDDTVVADFTAAGDAANPLITVTDTADGDILYRVRNVTNLPRVNFELLDGDDTMTLTAAAGLLVDVEAGRGNDVLDASSTTANDAPVTLRGGDGNDNLIGTDPADGAAVSDVLFGGDGDDRLEGGRGRDQFFGGAGNDYFVWVAGDGSDLMEGGTGDADQLIFIANDGDTVLQVYGGGQFTNSLAGFFPGQALSNSSRGIFELNAGQVFLNTGDVESIQIDALGGNDNIVINNQVDANSDAGNPITQGTDLGASAIDSIEVFAGTGDDDIEVHGTVGDDNLDAALQGGQITVTGLPIAVQIDAPAPEIGDTLYMHGQEGNDNIKAAAGLETSIGIVLAGDAGDDFLSADAILLGGPGDDFLEGGAGNDQLFGEEGEDILIGGGGLDTIDGGDDYDQILIRGTSANDAISVTQSAAGTLDFSINGIADTDTIVTVAGVPTVESVRVESGDGADTIAATWSDALGVDADVNSLRIEIDGGDDFAADRLGVLDDGTGDLVIQHVGAVDTQGGIQIGPGIAEPLTLTYENVEIVQPVAAADGRIEVFKHDPYEFNDARVVATHLGAAQTINVDPTIDPGLDPIFGLPADVDYFRLEAEVTGTLDIQAFYEQIATVASGRPGLPGSGDLSLQLFDADGDLIAGAGNFGTLDTDDNGRIRVPVVQQQVYFLQVSGASSNAINAYDLTIVNAAPPTPFDLELDDAVIDGVGDEGSDAGRNSTDNITLDDTPTLFFRLDDSIFLNDVVNPVDGEAIVIPFQNVADAAGYRVAVFDEGQTPGTGAGTQEPQVPLGFATQVAGVPGLYTFTTPVLSDGSHFLTARVQMVDPSNPVAADYGPRSDSLEIIVDTEQPPASFGLPAIANDGLAADSDSGVIPNPHTFDDLYTNDTTPTFWGQAEANTIIRVYVDLNDDGVLDANDALIGQTTAIPLDGNVQEPDGYWTVESVINMNDDDLFPIPDGLRTIFVTAEDVAGNVNTPAGAADTLRIFIDTVGPTVQDVYITTEPTHNLFGVKNVDGTTEPTPRIDSLSIDFEDLPNRVAPDFLFDALKDDIAQNPGHYLLRGDQTGIVAIDTVTLDLDAPADGAPATATVTLTFFEPLLDDRFTLTISDDLVDLAGNSLDGESNATEPNGGLPEILLPTGDGVPGGDFLARFTVDSRPEVGTYSQSLVYVDINGNGVWDPEGQDNDVTNRDFTYQFGRISDGLFAGDFHQGPGASSGFDKLGAYGFFNGNYSFLIDTDDDGVGNVASVMPPQYQVNGIPVAGDFDGDPTNGDEIGLFDGSNWYFDTDGSNAIEFGEILPANYNGIPIVGEFDGDNDHFDLAVWQNETNTFSFDLDADGNIDDVWDVSDDTNRLVGLSGFVDRPVTGDLNLDGIDELGIWIKGRQGQLPKDSGEYFFWVSDDTTALPSNNFNSFSHEGLPGGNDLFIQFGDDTALPIVGNFDPIVASGIPDETGTLTNEANVYDVNNDGDVSALDALLVINAINRGIGDLDLSSSTRVQATFGTESFYDVDGNATVSAIDALRVINELNRAQLTTPSTEPVAWADAVDSVFEDDDDDRFDEAIGLMF
ncbi:MAG: tandem-95 repeat protein [Planctomycetota bacterium]